MQDFSHAQKQFIQDLFLEQNTTITEKTDEIRRELKEQINKLKDDVISTTRKFERRIEDLEEENKKLHQNVIYLERRVRKNNLIIFGISTEESDLNKAVLTIFDEINVKVDVGDLNDVYRITTKTNRNPVIVELISFQQKLQILKNAHKLKGKNVYISKDQAIEDRERLKILLLHQKQARAKGQLAYIKGEKLYIDNKPYTINQLENPATKQGNVLGLNGTEDSGTQETGHIEEQQIKPNHKNKPKLNKERETSATRYTRSKKI